MFLMKLAMFLVAFFFWRFTFQALRDCDGTVIWLFVAGPFFSYIMLFLIFESALSADGIIIGVLLGTAVFPYILDAILENINHR